MITRFQVDGFKNLVGVDLPLGPFTCIAGLNGVGKSNLFDAIRFLGALASRPLMDAAAMVRDSRRAADVRSVFHRFGDACVDRMRFDVEMIVPAEAADDLGQVARATTTFLRYELELGLRADPDTGGPQLEVRHEALLPLKQTAAPACLRFKHSSKWRKSAVRGARRGGPYVSTETRDDGRRIIRRHQDGGSRGNPVPALAGSLRGTITSVAQADAPTLLCARREMQSWLQLQLEPSALRQPSAVNAAPRLQPNGDGLPAALFRIARTSRDPEATYARAANRLSELIHDVRTLSVERDEKLELLTLLVTDRQGTVHPARSLSDGTLRFLALAVLEADPESHGVLCMEEPENGIHPDRIAAVLALLQAVATDPEAPVSADNPLRQVIVNTHSPLVVGECPDDSLVLARTVEDVRDGHRFDKVVFLGVDETWRAEPPCGKISKGQLLAYLSPVSLQPSPPGRSLEPCPPSRVHRVRDRSDLHQLLLPNLDLPMRVAEP
jgi:predicted ATPase